MSNAMVATKTAVLVVVNGKVLGTVDTLEDVSMLTAQAGVTEADLVETRTVAHYEAAISVTHYLRKQAIACGRATVPAGDKVTFTPTFVTCPGCQAARRFTTREERAANGTSNLLR